MGAGGWDPDCHGPHVMTTSLDKSYPEAQEIRPQVTSKSERAPGCCSPRGRKEADTTEQLNLNRNNMVGFAFLGH